MIKMRNMIKTVSILLVKEERKVLTTKVSRDTSFIVSCVGKIRIVEEQLR